MNKQVNLSNSLGISEWRTSVQELFEKEGSILKNISQDFKNFTQTTSIAQQLGDIEGAINSIDKIVAEEVE